VLELSYLNDTYKIINNLRSKFRRDDQDEAQNLDRVEHFEEINSTNKRNRGD
jgi:hypothetical protein